MVRLGEVVMILDLHRQGAGVSAIARRTGLDRKTVRKVIATGLHQDQGEEPPDQQTNGICERFHKTLLDEFYRVAFRKKVYDTPDALQADLDEWLAVYNEQRTHQGRWCFGKTPVQTFLDSAACAREKQNPAKASFDPADTTTPDRQPVRSNRNFYNTFVPGRSQFPLNAVAARAGFVTESQFGPGHPAQPSKPAYWETGRRPYLRRTSGLVVIKLFDTEQGALKDGACPRLAQALNRFTA